MQKYPKIAKHNNIITIEDLDIYPFCNSSELNTESRSSTFEDPNHHRFNMYCIECKKVYIKHQRCGKIWLTLRDHETLIKGMPNCFENFIFVCNSCNYSSIRRFYTEMNGIIQTDVLQYDGSGKRLYREFYICNYCGVIEEMKYD